MSANTERIYEAMRQSIVDGEPEDAERLAREALALGLDPLEAINIGFVPGINDVGKRFGCGEMFLPDLVRAGAAMKVATRILEAEMLQHGAVRPAAGVLVLGTVKGDIHEIGKNLVGTMFTANGYRVHDLGVDVPYERFAAAAAEFGADLVGVSALLTTTMMGQRRVIEALDKVGLRGRVKVLIGGAPVTREWAREIGADGYSEDAAGAVQMAKSLLAARAP
jgi:corrinoid protein of di/trimethylamine methyltransferase